MNQLLPIIRRQRRPLLPVADEEQSDVRLTGERPYLTPALSLPLARAGEGEADEPSRDGARGRSPDPSADGLQPIVADGAASVKASDANPPTPRKSR